MKTLLIAAVVVPASASTFAGDAKSRYTTKRIHDPNGTGKFYLGREIALVMSYHGAPWLERATREREEKLSLMIKSLGLKPGMNVADIGAGSGVISVLLSKAIGPKGTVYAVDIQPQMLKLLEAKAKRLKINNIKGVLGKIESPNLKPGTIDLAIFVDVYHEFSHPHEMMREIAKSLKPGGRAVLVEYRKEDPNVPIKEVHKMSMRQVRKELEQPELGLRWVETIHSLPRQHILIFQKPKR